MAQIKTGGKSKSGYTAVSITVESYRCRGKAETTCRVRPDRPAGKRRSRDK